MSQRKLLCAALAEAAQLHRTCFALHSSLAFAKFCGTGAGLAFDGFGRCSCRRLFGPLAWLLKILGERTCFCPFASPGHCGRKCGESCITLSEPGYVSG